MKGVEAVEPASRRLGVLWKVEGVEVACGWLKGFKHFLQPPSTSLNFPQPLQPYLYCFQKQVPIDTEFFMDGFQEMCIRLLFAGENFGYFRSGCVDDFR